LSLIEVGAPLEVERYALLASAVERVDRASWTGPSRRIHVDDVSAVVGQQQSGERPGDVVPEVDDPDSLEGAHASGPRPLDRSRTMEFRHD
jgi:hypothetical protein